MEIKPKGKAMALEIRQVCLWLFETVYLGLLVEVTTP
jgi:hypothetical protein